jgi:cysteinyl-tRNA synthetase
MTLQVYSTLTRRKEPFHKQPGETVTMYVCGPTVYKPSHIGHMVGPVIFDTVKRYLTWLGYRVRWVVNITDVDDKLIERARELGVTVPALAREMTEDYFRCLQALHVEGIDHFPKATEYVPFMIEIIQALEAKGYAYRADGDVYFDISRDPDYGKLCHRDSEQMAAGARLEINPKKRNPGDFALWKAARADEPAEVRFDSPFGPGRPGWHIECSAMSLRLLGAPIDIHGGGLDLQFPHHENELAQSECYIGQQFVRIWMHNGLLKLRDKEGREAKMAGSLGNVLNVADALRHLSGDTLRFFILKTHYRTPIDLGIWDWHNPATPLPQGLVEARKAYETFERFAQRVQLILGQPFTQLSAPQRLTDPRSLNLPEHREAFERFRQFMDDDFNTGGAVGVLFDLIHHLNKLADQGRLDDPSTASITHQQAFQEGATLVRELANILGLTFRSSSVHLDTDNSLVPRLLQLVIDLRQQLREQAKKATKESPVRPALFGMADQIRSRLHELGILLEDRPTGTLWRWQRQ